VVNPRWSRSLSPPILLLKPLHCWRIGVDGLQPQWWAPGFISWAQFFWDDAFKAKLANVLEGNISRCLDSLTDQEPRTIRSEQPMERIFACFDRLTSKVFAVELQEIKRIELGLGVATTADEQPEIGGSSVITRDRLAVYQTRSAAKPRDSIRDEPEPLRPVVAAPRQQVYTPTVAARHYAEAVILDFVKPTWSEGWVSGSGG
jgi:hypothetical protein